MTDLDRTQALLGDLVGFATVSSDSNLALIDWAADRLQSCGARVDITAAPEGDKANLFATFGPEGDGGLILSGHSDVVPVADQDWSSDPFALTARGDRLFGRGTCDMKGFIACTLAMADEFGRWPLTRPLHIALTYDEEIGCFGARALAADLRARGLRPAMAILGEPTSMQVIEGHKGCCEYTTRFTGREGHGSAPDQGVNAVAFAVRYAARLLDLAEALKARAPAGGPFEPPWTTLNIGRLTGGTAHNIIAGQAELDWEMRPVTDADAGFVLAQIDRHAADLLVEMRAVDPEAAILRETIGEVAGLRPMAGNAAVALVTALTGANTTGLVPFSTEAGLFQELDIHCVVCGPGSIAQAHKPDEFVDLDQLAQCLGMLTRLGPHLT